MHTINLRTVCGSIILALALAILDLRAAATVGIDVNDGRSVIVPRPHTLAELLAAPDYTPAATGPGP